MKHLNILENLGLVRSERQANNRPILLERSPLNGLWVNWFEQFHGDANHP